MKLYSRLVLGYNIVVMRGVKEGRLNKKLKVFD